MMKKSICIFMTLVMLFTLVPAAGADEGSGDAELVIDESIQQNQFADGESDSDISTEEPSQGAEGDVSTVEETQTETVAEDAAPSQDDIVQPVETLVQEVSTDNEQTPTLGVNEGSGDAENVMEIFVDPMQQDTSALEESVSENSTEELGQESVEEIQTETAAEDAGMQQEDAVQSPETPAQEESAENTQVPSGGEPEYSESIEYITDESIQQNQFVDEESVSNSSTEETSNKSEGDASAVEETQNGTAAEDAVPAQEDIVQVVETPVHVESTSNEQVLTFDVGDGNEDTEPVIEESNQQNQPVAEESDSENPVAESVQKSEEDASTIGESQIETVVEETWPAQEDEDQKDDTSQEETAAVFMEGYATVDAGVTVYASANQDTPIGSFLSKSVMYVSVLEDVISWMKVGFATKDVLVTGYVLSNAVSILSDEKAEELMTGAEDSLLSYQGHTLPVCEFSFIEEKTHEEIVPLGDESNTKTDQDIEEAQGQDEGTDDIQAPTIGSTDVGENTEVIDDSIQQNQSAEVESISENPTEESTQKSEEEIPQSQENPIEETGFPIGETTVEDEQPGQLPENEASTLIITQPHNISAAEGEQVTFSVIVEGDDVAYQWLNSKDGENWNEINASSQSYQGALTSSLSFQVKNSTAIRKYRCQITIGEKTVLSDVVSVLEKTETTMVENSNKEETVDESINRAEGTKESADIIGDEKDAVVEPDESVKGSDDEVIDTDESIIEADQKTEETTDTVDEEKETVVESDEGIEMTTGEDIDTDESIKEADQKTEESADTADEEKETVIESDESIKGTDDEDIDTGESTKEYDQETENFTDEKDEEIKATTVKDGEDEKEFVEESMEEEIKGFRIIDQPVGGKVALDSSVAITINAVSDNDIIYQWQYSKDGVDWKDIKRNSTAFQGSDTSTLSFSATNAALERKYRCLLTCSEEELISDIVVFQISEDEMNSSSESTPLMRSALRMRSVPAVAIEASANKTSATDGETVTLTVTGIESLQNVTKYKWERSTDNASWFNTSMDTGTATMSFEANESRLSFYYRCVVTDDSGAHPSNGLKVERKQVEPSNIVATANKASATDGETVTLTVTGIESLQNVTKYKWERSTDNASWFNTSMDTGTATMSFEANESRLSFYYRCVVTDDSGAHPSNGVKVERKQAEPSNIVATANKASATDGETVTLRVTGIESLQNVTKYKWERSTDNASWFNTGMDTGTATMSFEANESRLSFYYRCVVTDDSGAHPSNGVKVERKQAEPSNIVATANKVSATDGETVTLTVTGIESLQNVTKYKWERSSDNASWFNTSMDTGTATMSFEANESRLSFYYRCVVTDDSGAHPSNGVNFERKQPEQSPVIVSADKAEAVEGETVTLTATGIEGMQDVTYKWERSTDDSIWFNTGMDTGTATMSFLANESRLSFYYRCVVTDSNGKHPSNGIKVQYNKYKASADKEEAAEGQQVTLTVSGADASANIAFKWERSSDGVVWFNTGMNTGTATMSFLANESRLSFYYRCVVTDDAGTHPSNGVKVEFKLPDLVNVVAVADKETAIEGETVTFSVNAEEAVGDLSYKWERSFDGNDWFNTSLNTNQDSMSFTANESRLSYYYRCVVTDDSGAHPSNAVKIEISEAIIVDNVVYAKKDTSSLIVENYQGAAAEVEIPEKIGDMTVVEIGEGAFEGNKTLVTIHLPDTIQFIRNGAFKNCSNLANMD